MADRTPDFSDTLNGSYVSLAKTVGAGAQVLAAAGASNLANRELLIIYNDGAKDIFVGPTGVSKTGASKGIPISPGETVSYKVGPNVDVYCISDVGNQNIIFQEWT